MENSRTLFSVSGRASRKEYCIYVLTYLAISFVIDVFINVSGPRLLLAIFFIFLYIPMWVALVRRLHDMDKTRKASLVVVGLFLVTSFLSSFLFAMFALTPFMALKGTDGKNQFGENHNPYRETPRTKRTWKEIAGIDYLNALPFKIPLVAVIVLCLAIVAYSK